MTLHSAKGLEFRTVFLPGWEEGLFPSQRTMDESGTAGLEEERRLAYVGITRARERARIFFAANRRVYNLWQAALPSRFIGELPAQNVNLQTEQGLFSGSVREQASNFEMNYDTPGMRRMQASRYKPSGVTIEAKARPVAATPGKTSDFKKGEKVFHLKFGYGQITDVDGNKLEIDFDKAGRKRVIDSFVEPA